jgi:sarcosine oxidase subunit gamma
VSDLTLTAAPALGGYHADFGAVTLEERPATAIVSIACPLGGAAALEEALRAGFGAAVPAPGASARSADGGTRFLWMAPDLVLAVFEHDTPDATRQVAARLGGTAYLTDQTDAWVALRIAGPAVRAALERICPLDLHPGAFPEGRVARTVMEHLPVIILREGPDAFLLLSARSSADSFLHAVETSIRNVL